MAAVWERDGRDAAVLYGQDANDILEEDLQFRSRKYYAADVAGYLEWVDNVPKERYAGVRVGREQSSEESWIYIGAGPSNRAHTLTDEALFDGGFGIRVTLQLFCDAVGELRYSGVRQLEGNHHPGGGG